MDLVILIGLQASGKTTFRKQAFAGTHVEVSKDDWPNARNREARQRRLVATALAEGRSVVVDNTNPAPEDRAALIALGKEHGARIVGYFFEPDLEASRARNALRPGRACVPEVALRHTLGRLRPPTRAEGFDALYRVRLGEQDFCVEADLTRGR